MIQSIEEGANGYAHQNKAHGIAQALHTEDHDGPADDPAYQSRDRVELKRQGYGEDCDSRDDHGRPRRYPSSSGPASGLRRES